jgi:hypothetical protein
MVWPAETSSSHGTEVVLTCVAALVWVPCCRRAAFTTPASATRFGCLPLQSSLRLTRSPQKKQKTEPRLVCRVQLTDFFGGDVSCWAAAFCRALLPESAPRHCVLDDGWFGPARAKRARPASDAERAAALLAERPGMARTVLRHHPAVLGGRPGTAPRRSSLPSALRGVPAQCQQELCHAFLEAWDGAVRIQLPCGQQFFQPATEADVRPVLHALQLLADQPGLVALEIDACSGRSALLGAEYIHEYDLDGDRVDGQTARTAATATATATATAAATQGLPWRSCMLLGLTLQRSRS